MKKIFLCLLAGTLAITSFAQARLATADYQKSMQPAVETELPFTEKTVGNAIEDKMQKLGYKGKETKGYVLYRGVRLQELGAESYDLYIRSERKSKKEKDATVVTMMVSSGFEKFIGDTTNATVINGAKNYLNSLTEIVAAYDLEQQIKDQEEALKKATKKYDGLVDDSQSLQKKKAKLEAEIAENTNNQANQKAETEKQKQILDTLKAKRKP